MELRDAVAEAKCVLAEKDARWWAYSCKGERTKHPECATAAFVAWLRSDEARAAIIPKLTPCLAQPLGDDDLECYLLDGHVGDHMFAFPRGVYADAAIAALAAAAERTPTPPLAR